MKESSLKAAFNEDFSPEYFNMTLAKFKDKEVRDAFEAHLIEYMWMAYVHGFQQAGNKIRTGL